MQVRGCVLFVFKFIARSCVIGGGFECLASVQRVPGWLQTGSHVMKSYHMLHSSRWADIDALNEGFFF